MDIKLISPRIFGSDQVSRTEAFVLPRHGLEIVAAHTPAEHSVTIVDETVAPDDAKRVPDLVGITATTHLALRAYQIADGYRQRGATVVMGGIHPTVLPAEALLHADAVVVGEAEGAWERLLEDASRGSLQKIYRNDAMVDMARYRVPLARTYPKPRRPLPFSTGIETSRGCRYGCEFCSTASVMGHRYRARPVDEVAREISCLGARSVFILDDAIGHDRAHAFALFRAMEPLGIRWIGQGMVSIAEDRGLVRALRRSGCVGILLGLESIQSEAQSELAKLRYLTLSRENAVLRFHDEGIAVVGSFVFGGDHDTADVFDRTFAFAMRCRLDGANPAILLPYPGTRLYNRLAAEGRLLKPLWWLEPFSSLRVAFRPMKMTPDELLGGWLRFGLQMHSFRGVARRFLGIGPWQRGLLGTAAFFAYNAATGRFFKAAAHRRIQRSFPPSRCS